MADLRQFNGGLHTASAQHLIAPHEGAVYSNIDHVPGTLTPLANKVARVSSASRFGHYFTGDATWYWSYTPKDWLEFQERLYVGSRTGSSKKLQDGVYHNLGIVGPTTPPRTAAESLFLADIRDAKFIARGSYGPIFPLATGDFPVSIDVEYRIVSNNAAGELSAGGTVFPVSFGSALSGSYTLIYIDDPAWVDEARVYRKFDGVWRHVTTMIYDDTVEDQPVYLDVVYDISANVELDEATLGDPGAISGVVQYAITYYNEVDGSESVPVLTDELSLQAGQVEFSNLPVSDDPQVTHIQLYRIGGDLTAYHFVVRLPNGTTTYTDNTHNIDLEGRLLTSQTNYPAPQDLHWMLEAYAMLFGAVGDKLHFTPIGQPNAWPLTYYLDFPNTITGIGKTPIGLLVFTDFESYLVTGTGPLALSQQLLTSSQGCVSGDSVVNVQGAVYWASSDGICISEGGRVIVYTREKLRKLNLRGSVNAVVYDQEYYLLLEDQGKALILDTARKTLRHAEFGVRSFITAQDTLYGFHGGVLHELNASDTKLPMHYVSPQFTGPGLTVQKVYKNIYVNSTGEVEVAVVIDDLLVQRVILTTTDNHQIKIPAVYTRGFKIHFEITGTGTVHEITWSDGNANQ